MKKIYFAEIENMTWNVSFPDFPGCTAVGNNPGQAIGNAHTVLQARVDMMLEKGEDLPEEGNLEFSVPYITGEKTKSDAKTFLAMITINIPSPSVKVTITLPGDLPARIKTKTNNMSKFLADAAREKLKNC
jgi:predicted RNase H-like HicB family nuclease